MELLTQQRSHLLINKKKSLPGTPGEEMEGGLFEKGAVAGLVPRKTREVQCVPVTIYFKGR